MKKEQREAKKAGVNLDEDIIGGGLTKYPKIKRDWHYCPRCRQKRINRISRKCDACGGKVLFHGDDGRIFNERMDHWYMWMKSVFNVEGYFDKDYFSGGFNSNKY
jgi:hypothetical protein